MIRKFASIQVLDAWRASADGSAQGLKKTSHRVDFQYEARKGYLYVRSRMISSRTNDNHDTFPAGEIEKGYRTFLGKPVFVNHHNANHRRARGVIVAVALHRDKNPDGSPDTWVEGLHEVDAVRFPKLAKAILAGKVNRTSMGVDVEWSHCSACGNKATSPAEYCNHLPALKGKKIRKRNQATGKVEEKLIHEICAGLSFFENSLLVEDPADPTAAVLDVPDARGLKGLDMSPRTAGADHRDGHVAHVIPVRDPLKRDLASPGTAPTDRYQGQKFVFDDPNVGFGELDSRVAYARQAASLGHHVGGVDRVGAQEPVQRVHADLEVAPMADNQARRNRTSKQLPSVPMRPDTRPLGVRQGEARITTVEGAARPRITESRTRGKVNRGEVPIDLGSRADESSIQFGPADHGVYSNGRKQSSLPSAYVIGKVDDRGLRAAASKNAAGDEYVPKNGDPRYEGVSLRKDKDGFYVATHRARSKSYPSPEKIPDGRIEFIRSTGARRTAATGDPDFRDHIPNPCTQCGNPVSYSAGKAKRGSYPWQHHSQFRFGDHQAVPASPENKTGPENLTFDAGHCLLCGDPVRINLAALDLGGGWHHGDGMKRDHEAMPANEPAAYDSIPVQKAMRDQARQKVRDTLHGQFEQLSGRPLPRLPRGDEDQMPPDPFTSEAAKKREGGDHPFFEATPVSASNIVAAYHDTTDDEKSLGDHWYADAHHVAKAIAGGDAAKGAGLLSAYSPQTAWPVNMFNASRAAQGDPPGPGSGAMGIHQKSAMRILGGEHHSKVLKAPKTAAFAHLIEHGGDTPEDEKHGTEKVVVDRHALSVAAGRRLSKEEGGKAPLGQHQHYDHVAQLYRDAAHDLSKATGRKISPHQVQAATWLRQIRKNQEEDRSGKGGGGLGAGRGRVQMQDNSKTRWQKHHREHHPGAIPEENMHHHGQRKTAYGETRVPPQVDTLRMEECPVCGEGDVWSGDRCPVCGFIVPPSLFRDPDVSKAQQVRDELDQQGEVITQPGAPGDPSAEQIGSGQDADSQLMHPDQIAPDGTPGVQGEGGPVPAADTDGMPPQDPEAEAQEGEAEEEQGEEDQEQGAAEQEQGQELEEQAAEDEGGDGIVQPDLECPACGAAYATDMAAQPGTPCPACRQGSLQPAGGPQKDQEDPDAEEEDEGEEDMPQSKTAAALARAQAQRMAALTAENEALKAQLSFLASAAGVGPQLAAIRQDVLRRHADMLNPASPVPDPPEAPAPESTEQALMPAAMDDPSRPGTTPGANTHVPAEQTTTAITPGVEMQTPPATNLIDVTAPVQGTNPSQDGGVPLEQRRIETDVRIDPDPLKAHGPGIGGVGDNGAAFPWLLDNPQQPQNPNQRAASVQGGEASAAQRTFASIRLAKLRMTAGLAQGDELAVAERIEKDAALSTPMIEHEIQVLSGVSRAAAPQRPMQRAAMRSAPSLASVGAAQYAPAGMAAGDDLDGSDIFL